MFDHGIRHVRNAATRNQYLFAQITSSPIGVSRNGCSSQIVRRTIELTLSNAQASSRSKGEDASYRCAIEENHAWIAPRRDPQRQVVLGDG